MGKLFFWLKYANIQVKMMIITKSAEQTQKVGESLIRELEGKRVICLEGELGSGKTTFIQGLAKGLGIKERITSPTFVLVKRFRVPDKRFVNFYHIDCYRIKDPKELLDLGFEEILEEKDGLIVIELAEQIDKILPKDKLVVKFEVVGEKKRKITFKNFKFLMSNSK